MSAIQKEIDYARKNYEETKKTIKDYYKTKKLNDYQVEQLQKKLDKAKADFVKFKEMPIEKRLTNELNNAKGSETISTKFANMALVKEIFNIMKPELTTWGKLKKFEPFTTLDKDWNDKEFNEEFYDLEYNLKNKVKKKMSPSEFINSLNKSLDDATTRDDFAEIRGSLKILKEGYDNDTYGAVIKKKFEILVEKFNKKFRSLFPNEKKGN